MATRPEVARDPMEVNAPHSKRQSISEQDLLLLSRFWIQFGVYALNLVVTQKLIKRSQSETLRYFRIARYMKCRQIANRPLTDAGVGASARKEDLSLFCVQRTARRPAFKPWNLNSNVTSGVFGDMPKREKME
jgi:hypothetical protein